MKSKKRESKKKGAAPVVSAARAAAFDILLRVERESSYASELLHSRAYDSLTPPDHALATELVMGALRWKPVLDSEIAQSASQPLARLDLEILVALRLAVYQLRWLTRVPARAAINESVELVKRARKRSAAPFVNAVLRKLATKSHRPLEIDGASPETLAASGAHPVWLVERWFQAYGGAAALQICRQNQSVPVTAIRLRRPEAERRLLDEGIVLAPGGLIASARRVISGDITKTASFRAGLCAIQDEASQLVAALVGKGVRFLDCCAAPGGKTMAVADRNLASSVIAVDLHPHRARLLRKLLGRENRTAGGASAPTLIVAADARALPFVGNFDRILADVPCSGTGTISRNPEIKWRLVPNDLLDLQERQLAILGSGLNQVAPGGRLIYSTCSLEREENEDVIDHALAENASFRVVDCGDELEALQRSGELTWQDLPSLRRGPYLRTLPGIHPCDGFFAAIIERRE